MNSKELALLKTISPEVKILFCAINEGNPSSMPYYSLLNYLSDNQITPFMNTHNWDESLNLFTTNHFNEKLYIFITCFNDSTIYDHLINAFNSFKPNSLTPPFNKVLIITPTKLKFLPKLEKERSDLNIQEILQ